MHTCKPVLSSPSLVSCPLGFLVLTRLISYSLVFLTGSFGMPHQPQKPAFNTFQYPKCWTPLVHLGTPLLQCHWLKAYEPIEMFVLMYCFITCEIFLYFHGGQWCCFIFYVFESYIKFGVQLLLKIICNKLFLMHLFVSLLHFAVISELIHYTAARNSGGVSEQMPLIQVIVPQVMNLRAQLRDSSKVTIWENNT